MAVLALAFATWLERPRPVTAQSTYTQPVKVMNAGSSQAIPVSPTGTTPVSGTVTVGNSSLPVSINNSGLGNSIPIRLGAQPWDYVLTNDAGQSVGIETAYQPDFLSSDAIFETLTCFAQPPLGFTGGIVGQVSYAPSGGSSTAPNVFTAAGGALVKVASTAVHNLYQGSTSYLNGHEEWEMVVPLHVHVHGYWRIGIYFQSSQLPSGQLMGVTSCHVSGYRY
jgi:hypothetical protein